MTAARPAFLPFLLPCFLVLLLWGCTPKISRYILVENSLQQGDTNAADHIIAKAEDDYGSESRVLYGMDRGMTLQLAGRYEESNSHLEQADEEVEDLYTRRMSTEVKAFLVNDNELPFEGEPFEQVSLNVAKALNYALMQDWDEALVEARRIDHRLNVLADRVDDKTQYRDDHFARYLSGILYEISGDNNNAFIAYRKAYEAYRSARSWSRTPVPPMLRTDLLRVTDALHLTEEHEGYREEFGELTWQPYADVKDLAQLIVISYNGRAPKKVDQFVDLPISLEALQLVLLTKSVTGTDSDTDSRLAESVLYGLSGRVVRVALPKLIPQKTQVTHSLVTLSGPNGSADASTELAYDFTATAKKSLEDRFVAIATKAVARASTKFALAEGAQHGARHAGGKRHGPLIGLFVGIVAKTLAVASEEADKRSWRTLPDEIQVARLWVPPGDYRVRIQAVNEKDNGVVKESVYPVTFESGQARFILERVLP